MKLRNQLLALFCLLAFVGFGFLYFRTWVVQKPFGIILFVSDGLAGGNLAAARLYEGGADHRLAVERLANVAVLTNFANDFAVPDSAAAASALATGVKVNNNTLSMDAQGRALATLLEAARASGRATGIVTTGPLAGPSAAAFYAHAAKSGETEAIAAQLTDGAGLNLALGGGASDMLPESKGGHRKDGRDLLLETKQKGSEVFRSKADLENAPVFTTAARLGVFSGDSLSYSNQITAGSQHPSLTDMVRRAIEFLQYNRNGYLLVVDSSLITRAAEENDAEHAITETIEFDRAFSTAMKYAGEKALLVAVGKHATGGMALNGYPLRQDHGVGLLGINSFGYPSITWSTGPNGHNAQPRPAAETSGTQSAPDAAMSAPAAFYTPQAINNAGDVLAIGIGPGSEALKGFLDNTAIYQILKKEM